MFQSSGLENPYHYGDDTINVMAYLGRFFSRWHYFLVGIVIALILAFIQIRTTPRIYRIGAKVILGSENMYGGEKDQYQRISNYLTSEMLVRETVKGLGNGIRYFQKKNFNTRPLYENLPFTIAIDSSHNQLVGLDIYIDRINDQEYKVVASGRNVDLYSITKDKVVKVIKKVNIEQKIAINEPFVDSLLSFSVDFKQWKPAYNQVKFYFRIQSLGQKTAFFHKNLVAQPLNEEANIILLTIDGPLVELSKDFLNAHLETYKTRKVIESLSKAESTIEALDASILEILEEVRGKPLEKDSLSIDEIADSLSFLSLKELEIRRLESRRRMAYFEGVLESINKSGKEFEFSDPETAGMEDDVLSVLLVKYTHLLEEKTDLAFKTGKRGPLWKMNEMDLEKSKSDLIQHLSKAIRTEEEEIQKAEIEMAELMGKLGGSGEVTDNKDYYDLLEEREAALNSLKNASSYAEVIENARLEGRNPIAPKKSLILLFAIIAGLGMPAGIIVFQDFINRKMVEPLDIESGTNIPVLGFVTRHEEDETFIISRDDHIDIKEAFRSLWVKLNYLNTDQPLQVIGLTSSGSGEGKTFCSANFAASLAKAGYKTLLMDVDLRRPRITRYFENSSGKGLSNYLSEESGSIFDLIFPADLKNLSILPAGDIKVNPMELLQGNRMADLIEELRGEYDHIVLDSPPVGLVADYTLLMKSTDFNIYVVRESTTRADALNWINGMYDRKELTNVGLLINDVRTFNDSVLI